MINVAGTKRRIWCWGLGLVLGLSGALYAQCPWVGSPMCSPGTTGPYQTCSRLVNPTDACNLDANGGMTTTCTEMTGFCHPEGGADDDRGPVDGLLRVGCGVDTCRIELSDGLPVELMEFSVDEDEPEGKEEIPESDE